MSVRQIGSGFAKARDADSVAGEKVGVGELRKIVADAVSGGFTEAEKQKVADEWHTQVKGTHGGANPDPSPAGAPGATLAAQRYFAQLQRDEALPVPSQLREPAPGRGRLPLAATSNDPGLTLESDGTNVTFRGVGSNRGTAPSFATLTVEGRQLDVDVSRGMTPAQLLQAFEAQLPAGVSLTVDAGRPAQQGALTVFATRGQPQVAVPKLSLRATENDSGLSIAVRDSTATISGVGVNRGVAPSFATFTIEGRQYDVDVRRGMTPGQVVDALRAKLPNTVNVIADARPDGSVAIFASRGVGA